ncbi:MAG: FAD-dependent monooxygenase, partial [Flavitalea sp.]
IFKIRWMSEKTIGIIGAGIGGLTMGLGLKRAGIPFRIYERAPEIRPVGAGIIMANNAMQVFKYFGIQHQVEQAGNKVEVVRLTDKLLRPLSSMPLAKFEKKYGVYNVAIHRAALQNVLAEEVGFENISLGKEIREIHPEKNYVLRFTDGDEVFHKVIIGADGIHSFVRKHVFEASELRPARQFCWRGISESNIDSIYNHQAFECWDRGKRFGFVKISSEKWYWFAVVSSTIEIDTAQLNELFKEFHPVVLTLINSTPADQIVTGPIMDLKPINSFTKNNMCLIGDAAHATTPNLGQGACQAVEDAFAITNLLKKGLAP